MFASNMKSGNDEDNHARALLALTGLTVTTCLLYAGLFIEALVRVLPYLRPLYSTETTPYRNMFVCALVGLSLGGLGALGGIVVVSTAFGLFVRIIRRWVSPATLQELLSKVAKTRVPFVRTIFFTIVKQP